MIDYKVYEITDGICKVEKKNVDWEFLINNINEWHSELAGIILKPETLYYYVMNRNDSTNISATLTKTQKELLKVVFKKFIDNPESFYDVVKKNELYVKEIDILKNNDELVNFIGINGLDVKCDPSKDFAINKASAKRELKLDRSFGIFGEFLFYSVIRELFGIDLLLSKVSLTTGNQVYAYGNDGIFYNDKDNSLFFGESKFTINILGGLKQALNSLQQIKSKIDSDTTLIIQQTKLIKGVNSVLFEEKTQDEILDMKKSIFVFVLYGENDYQDKDIIDVAKNYLNEYKSIDSTIYSISIIAFPIINKENLKKAIAERVTKNATDS